MTIIPQTLLILATVGPAATERPAGLPSYAYSVRCAGLAVAHLREAKAMSRATSARFDAALYWGLAASEAARNAKLGGPRYDQDMERSTQAAKAQLDAGDRGAEVQLKSCLKAVPPLRK